MGEGIINAWWLVGFIILSVITLISIVIALTKFSEKNFRSAMGKFLIANSFMAIGVIVHTAAILEFGTDTAQIMEFLIGHLLLLTGFIMLIVTIKNIKRISEEIGFV